jgi:hypothetical protein
MKHNTEIKLNHIINHLTDVYGFRVFPCLIPLNNFHRLKRNFYNWIHNKVSKKLFYFLRDKVSPIKYLNERPSGEIWLNYLGESGRVEFGIQIKPYREDLLRKSGLLAAFFVTDVKGIFKPQINGDNYRVKIFSGLNSLLTGSHLAEERTFPMNSVTGIMSIDAHLSDFKELKSVLRENKLKKILK